MEVKAISKREERITFRVTSKELKTIEDKAKKANVKISEYIRRATLRKNIIVIQDIKEFTKELKGIGRNINQLTILSHQGKIEKVDEEVLVELKEKVTQIWELLNLLTVKIKR